jgi:phosphatidylglycerophosphate synthase
MTLFKKYNNFTLDDAERVLTRPKGLWAVAAMLPTAKRLSVFIVNRTRITPNQISIASFVISFVAAYFFYTGNYILLVLGAVLFQLNYMLDCVDGTVARLKNCSTPAGAMLDIFLDFWRIPVCTLGLALGHYRLTGSTSALIYGMFYVAIKLIYHSTWRSHIGVLLQFNRLLLDSSIFKPGQETLVGRWKNFAAKHDLNPWPRSPECDVIAFSIGPLLYQIHWGLAAGFGMHFVIWLVDSIQFIHSVQSSSKDEKLRDYLERESIKNIAVFGTGSAADNFVEWFEENRTDSQITYFVDNNPHQQGREISGRKVYQPSQLLSNKPDLVVVTSKGGRTEISKQLEQMGMAENQEFIYANLHR